MRKTRCTGASSGSSWHATDVVRGRLVIAAMVFAAPLSLAKPPADLEPLIIGGFLCKENCSDEEYAFAKEDGVRRLNTYTHSRPSISGAPWMIAGNRLVVYEYDGKTVQYDFKVVSATAKRLVLQREGDARVVLERIVEKPKKKPAPAK